jgi:ferredoxin
MDTYYFSGTGNSLAVARDLVGHIGGKLTSIPSVMDKKTINTDKDLIGIVFPVYQGGFPLIIKRFIEKMGPIDKKYIFGVCTYGDNPGLAIDYLAKLIQFHGGQLAAGFAVNMPYNYLMPSLVLRGFLSSFTLREIATEKQQALFAAWHKRIGSISTFVNNRQAGIFETGNVAITRLVDYFNIKETLGKWVWLKIAGVDEKTELSFLESRQLMDRGFQADEKCTGCRICSRICPVGNINMVDNRPKWQHHCEQCFACLQWCPREAVQFGGKTFHRKRYHHPEVRIADMVVSKD